MARLTRGYLALVEYNQTVSYLIVFLSLIYVCLSFAIIILVDVQDATKGDATHRASAASRQPEF